MYDKEKIVTNSALLYVRMFVSLAISFYTSRIVLRELGVDDYGTFNVVGGVVAMFSSLRGLFSTSVQRFLNFEMGVGDKVGLRRVFSMGVMVHFAMSVVFLLFAETVGLWFVNHQLVIDPERMVAANWVFQLSIAAALVTIMTVPFDALIIAHERMGVFAWISILDAGAKLAIAFALSLGAGDKLIMYAGLILMVSFVTWMVSWFYCRRKFSESRLMLFWDKALFRKMGSFAGWNFVGNSTFTIVHEGVNFLLNFFGGVAANAARGIAYRVMSMVSSFMANILTAISPQMVKMYAKDDLEEYFKLVYASSRLSFFVILMISVPLMAYIEPLLDLWLGLVPEHAGDFIRLILCFQLVRSLVLILDIMFLASGQIRTYQVISSSITVLTVPVSYVLLKWGYAPLEIVFVVMLGFEVVNLTVLLLLARRIVGLRIVDYLKRVMLRCVMCAAAASGVAWGIYRAAEVPWWAGVVVIGAMSALTIWIIGLTKTEKGYIKKFVRR